MIGSVHLADLPVRTSLRTLARAPKAGSVDGLRQAELGVAGAFTSSFLPKPDLHRVALVAFWDDADAIDRFEAADPLAARLAGGWSARLEPIRLHGSWPGVPDDLHRDRRTEHTGPSVVVTLGRTRPTQLRRFLRASARAEGAALEAPGLLWGTGIARPPTVVSLSLWESTKDLSTYAYGRSHAGHPTSIAEGDAERFHSQEAFVRFRVLEAHGHLDGRNPLAEATSQQVVATT